MKKKLLFVIPSLDAGGAEKSLINLLHTIDKKKYEIDLFLLSQQGLFLTQVPNNVRILSRPQNLELFMKPVLGSVMAFLKQGKFGLARSRVCFAWISFNKKNPALAEQKSWHFMKRAIGEIEGKYDVAISYLEKSSAYFVADLVCAEKKLAWIHTDYEKSGQDPEFDRKYFTAFNQLVTISEHCKQSLELAFPEKKVTLIENIISPKLISVLGEMQMSENHWTDGFRILTIARLSEEKGIDLAVSAAKALADAQINFLWMIIGEGAERTKLEGMINRYNLQDYIKLIGLRENPYPYLKSCDVYVQPSRREGKSMAIEEARIFSRPIIVTDYPAAKDQIDDGLNGMIVEMNAEAIAEGIKKYLNDDTLNGISPVSFMGRNFVTESQIEKFYELLKN